MTKLCCFLPCQQFVKFLLLAVFVSIVMLYHSVKTFLSQIQFLVIFGLLYWYFLRHLHEVSFFQKRIIPYAFRIYKHCQTCQLTNENLLYTIARSVDIAITIVNTDTYLFQTKSKTIAIETQNLLHLPCRQQV